MKRIILINGLKGAGKNYLSEVISELEESTKEFSIAAPAKKIIARTLDISENDLDTFKNDSEGYGVELKAYPNNQPQCTIEYLSFRNILQNFAVDAMMETFGEKIWVTKCAEEVIKSNYVFNTVTDFRFPFEYEVFKDIADKLGFDVITINIFNKELENDDNHISENAMNDFKFDYTINNTGKPELKETMRLIMENIKSKSLDLY
jgi:hypothetical protein